MIRPSHRRSRRASAIAAPVLLAAVALTTLAACGGAVPAQSTEHSVVNGANGQVGDVLVRDANLTLRGDGTYGSFLVALVNSGTAPDRLVSVTAPGATFTLPAASALTASAASAIPQAGSPTASAGVDIQGQSAVFLNQPPSAITLARLAQPQRIGGALPVTLTFAAAGPITLQVPVSGDITGPGGLESAAPQVSEAGVADGGSTPAP